METASGKQSGRAAAAAFVGTMIEWYDFYLYATASALVFAELYFPTHDAFTSTMASFATFAVGFFARPVGAVLFGHIGDRIGRKSALMTTLVLMGVATIGIGMLPDYSTWGIAAPLLLVVLRVLQGVSAGGEWGGAVLMAGEHAPDGRRVFFSSFAQLGSPVALIMSLVAFRLAISMPHDQFIRYGWRIPFLISIILLAVGIVIRKGVNESPEFESAKKKNALPKLPIVEAFKTCGWLIVLGIGANTLGIACSYFTNTFMISYVTQALGIQKTTILDILFGVAIVQALTQLLAAWAAEKVGSARFLRYAAVLAVISPYPMFVLVSTGQKALMFLGISLAVICMACFYSIIAGFISSIFPVRVRYTAISISYQVCGAVAGGLTPLIGTWLAHESGGQWMPLAIFYSVLAATSLVCVHAMDRYRSRSTKEDDLLNSE
jgi:MFS family permease